MKTYAIVISALTILILVAVAWPIRSTDEWRKISPFTAVQIENEKILAQYQGAFYEVSAIAGISSSKIIETSRKTFKDHWQKRIIEDIAEVLEAAGAPNSKFVSLKLIEPQSGAVKTIEKAEMTTENRQKIYRGI